MTDEEMKEMLQSVIDGNKWEYRYETYQQVWSNWEPYILGDKIHIEFNWEYRKVGPNWLQTYINSKDTDELDSYGYHEIIEWSIADFANELLDRFSDDDFVELLEKEFRNMGVNL